MKKEEEKDKDTASSNSWDEDISAISRILKSVWNDVVDGKERRKVYGSLAWTGPVDNTDLQNAIPYAKVANMALDMLTDTTAVPADGVGDGGGGSSDDE